MSRVSRCAALWLFAATPLVAQEPSTPDSTTKKQWGIGVTLNPTALLIDDVAGFLPIGLNNFVVPIRVGPHTIIEPEFGLFRVSTDDGSDFSSVRLGVGILAGLKERSGLKPYVGPRIGIARTSSESGGSEFKQTTWFVSAVLGAQHFFTPHFSLGGEVQLTLASAGEPDVSPAPPFPITSGGQSMVSTNGIALLRFFF